MKAINQIGGARLGGATKELPANLDAPKGTPNQRIPFANSLFRGSCLGTRSVDFCASVRPSVPAGFRPDTIREFIF